jgi:hypothetical protein
MRPYRELRREMIEEYVGTDYGINRDPEHATLVNLLNVMVDTYVVALAANRPRVMVDTFFNDLRPFAERYQVAINNTFIEIEFQKTLQLIVQDALFGMGIAKICFVPGNPVEVANPEIPPEPGMFDPPEAFAAYEQAQMSHPPSVFMDAGRPFVERVSLDDFCLDMSATEWSRIRWATHHYRVRLADVKNDDRFDKEVVEKLAADGKWSNPELTGEEKTKDIFNNGRNDDDDIDDMITLMDVWNPLDQTWAVMVPKLRDLPPLLQEEWNGPENGPFLPLTFQDVPDNVMPVAPVANAMETHRLANHLLRKVAEQAKNQKTLLLYQGDGKDAGAVATGQDMQAIRVANPHNIREAKFNGPDSATLGFQQIITQFFDQMAGNLNALAGLGPSSSTARQDEMINSAAGARPAKMQLRVTSFVEKVARQVGWMLWVDQTKNVPGEMRLEGLSQPVPATWTPEDREGDFFQYNFSVEPYSMAYQSPTQRVQALTGVLQTIYVPLMQMMQAEGKSIDYDALTQILAKYLDLPQLQQVITNITAPMDGPQGRPPGGGPSQPQAPQVMPTPGGTTSEYIRRDADNPLTQKNSIIKELLANSGESSMGATA